MTDSPVQQRSSLPQSHVINPRFSPFRSSSRPRRPSRSPAPDVGHPCSLPYPSGDGATVPALSIRSRINPGGNQGTLSLPDESARARPRRRASMASFPLRIGNGGMDARETPIHEISKSALTGLTQLISSEGLKRTASNLLTSVVRIGSGILNTGIQVASNFLSEDADVPAREDEVAFRGFVLKAVGNSLTLRSIHAEGKDGVRVVLDLDQRLSSSPPASLFTDDQLKLSFGFENSVEVVMRKGSNPEDVNWTNEENTFILHLH